MSNTYFTPEEIDNLCDLYLESALSVKEERLLRSILINGNALSEKAKTVARLIEMERMLVIEHNSEIKRVRSNTIIHWSIGVAASLAVVFAIGWLAIGKVSKEPETHYAVWQNGVKIYGDQARIIAERNIKKDMEAFNSMIEEQDRLINESLRQEEILLNSIDILL